MKIFHLFSSRLVGRGAAPASPACREDWKPGDLAECVYDGPWYQAGFKSAPHGWGPVRGELRIVETVGLSVVPPREPMLGFRHYGSKRFSASAFRKVEPRADAAEAADEAFTQILRRESIVAPAEVSLGRAIVVHLVLPVAGLSAFGYLSALMLWAITVPAAAV